MFPVKRRGVARTGELREVLHAVGRVDRLAGQQFLEVDIDVADRPVEREVVGQDRLEVGFEAGVLDLARISHDRLEGALSGQHRLEHGKTFVDVVIACHVQAQAAIKQLGLEAHFIGGDGFLVEVRNDRSAGRNRVRRVEAARTIAGGNAGIDAGFGREFVTTHQVPGELAEAFVTGFGRSKRRCALLVAQDRLVVPAIARARSDAGTAVAAAGIIGDLAVERLGLGHRSNRPDGRASPQDGNGPGWQPGKRQTADRTG
jgi:hypothetical protein